MRNLAGTTWGDNEQILKTVYEGSVRPVLEYSSTAWSTTEKTNQQSLYKIQNQALRIMVGAMKSHHIHGANHHYTTSTTETTSKGPSSGKKKQVPSRPSHEGEGRGPYQEHNKEKQYHTCSKEATERLHRSADNSNPSTQ